ncbi:hypothetical protein ACWT_1488 [Actinoplanes sp. SE50]|uniref:hypothetical protein n=1 Tax=unclassified Actinoplanes TaxID=2626549 RepID=UPI00023EC58F|nr:MULTISPECIES: hypothetical protein [unclassified Actinoplanes]AEV82506.1 hypothetical protein ACPL_1609 [Actinoplanes sp. SE50/110]ATO80903.1 hypothetical protein ACWT_1488 [Actinoplanes sp. SE50]SLL98310.1 hypothetical protein ACSP50_1536 [Actinoplanes sp. SE50/110]
MDSAVDMAYRVVEALFGPDSGIPWWAWLAPIAILFARLLYPMMFPEAAAAEAETDRRLAEFRREREGQARDRGAEKGKGKEKKGKKGKK